MRAIITCGMVQEYILDNNLTENDIIVLHPSDYDYVATEYVNENNLTMYRPVEILGTLVVEDTGDEVKRNQIYVMPLAAS